jgi:hypothetical protein
MMKTPDAPNQSMKPTAPYGNNSVVGTTRCRGLSFSRWMLSVSTRAIAASMVLLTSCSVFQPVIDVVPIGSLQQGVVFYLGDIFRPRPEFTVTGLTVLEEQSDGSRRAVWIAEGAQPLRYITYGAKYPGLQEARPPLPLKRGKRYEVFLYTSTGGKSVDLFAFRVDENGNVKQVPWFRF